MRIRLSLKNWRSVDDATIDLAPFTVIVGKNSSGKSNIVDALAFTAEVRRDAATAVRRRGGIASIRRWGPSKPYAVSIETIVSDDAASDTFLHHSLTMRSGKEGEWWFEREKIDVSASGEVLVDIQRTKKSMNIKSAKAASLARRLRSIEIPADTSAMLYARQFGYFNGMPAVVRGLSAVRALRPVPELMRQPQPPSDSSRLVENASNIGTALQSLDKDQHANIVSGMRRIVPELVDVRAEPAGRYVSLVFAQTQANSRQSEFVATEMSDGALRALAVLVAAQQVAANDLLIIEEPEVNLHPGAAGIVYDALRKASTVGAVLVTTHSPELLDRAKDDEILVCDYIGGVTKVGPLAKAQRKLVRDGLFSVAEIMRSEELRREGAQPKVVSSR